MNNFFKYNPFILNKETYQALSQNDMPPTLYSLMNSYVNFNKEESEKIKIIDLPLEFKNYLFDFNYPLDDELKPNFEENFLTHYMFRRIGFETYMSFKIHLKSKLNEIMNKYNNMLKEFSKLDFLGVNEVHTRTLSNDEETTNSSTSSSSGTSGTTSDNRYSDTPENLLTNVQNGTYLTDYTYNQQTGTSSATATGSSSIQSNNELEETINIHRGDSTDEYLKYQDKINNIYTMIYKELDSLFYGII